MSQRVTNWLEQLGLGHYASAFAKNDISIELLRELTSDDLKDLGVASLGHRKTMLNAIALLSTDNSDVTKPVSEPATASSGVGEAERRQLTVMFCDLVGSTALSSRFDPEDLSDIVRSYQDTCAGVVSRFDGYVARHMGDGMLVYFGYPLAHEDDAERALHAGLEIIVRVGQLEPRADLSLQTRIGVATGLVVVGETIGEDSAKEQVVMGETPNLAARLQGVADPNQLIVADSDVVY